ncbi:MAG: ribonuclease Y [Patescibacteria group bacterium]|nr:ribonuclease Y [Patescibacteria group bacterium]MDE1945716.1 ribonuclease Y [Patescibacteria group bacterium]
MTLKVILFLAGSGLAGIVLGYFLRVIVALGKKGSIELEIKGMMLEAEGKAKKIVIDAEAKSVEIMKEVKEETRKKDEQFKATEDRLIKKEGLLDKRQTDLDKEVENVKAKVAEVNEVKARADKLEADKSAELAAVAKMTEEEAKTSLVADLEKKYADDLVGRMKKLEETGEEKLKHVAKEILITSIQRLSTSVAADTMSTILTLPSDEMKGKIIGKEGKNIKAFERVTGVEVIVDDSPGIITISSFDPIRRQVARIALENLLLDGRIQPAKIEKVVEKAQADINKIIKEKGEQAAHECGVVNLDPRVLAILGRLHFRTSYGQNVLQHSIEMAYISRMIAEETGANVQVAVAGALVHDIGKALTHEVAGTHVEIGRRILQKFGVSEDIIKAMQSHHEEYPYETLESVIVKVADTISGGRPGARSDSVESYIKRLGDLEALTNSFSGVEKSYALEAGREIRVFVTPEKVSDIEAHKLARDIADKIEADLKYPGEIKVTIIRETRVIEYAR